MDRSFANRHPELLWEWSEKTYPPEIWPLLLPMANGGGKAS